MVYVMSRDASSSLTISSPLEAHKSNTLCFAIVGLDVGFDNPVFACLEVDYADADEDPTGEAAEETPKVCHQPPCFSCSVWDEFNEPLTHRASRSAVNAVSFT